MAVIVWDKIKERSYEHGVDRGVIHVPGSLVLPWNGLVSVDETENNESEVHAQFDGITYANLKFGGFFQALVSAYTFPNQFLEIIGLKEALTGLYLTGQPRLLFNFSYRTQVGDNDYKLHFVHNAIASPVKRGFDSVSDNIRPEIFEWLINAKPPETDGIKPSAHMVVKSTDVDPAALIDLETLLYGTVSVDPYFPSQLEILNLIS